MAPLLVRGVSALLVLASANGLAAQRPTSISLSETEACFHDDRGIGRCWDMLADTPSAPVSVVGAARTVMIDPGVFGACALNGAGRVLCSDRLLPGGAEQGECESLCLHPLPSPDAAMRFSTISTGSSHACAIDTRGRGWCWGANHMGQLGNGSRAIDTTSSIGEKPDSITLIAGGIEWRAISVGDQHSCGVDTGGDIYCWGYGQSGAVGNAEIMTTCTGPRGYERNSCSEAEPYRVTAPVKFRMVSAGRGLTCGVSLDRSVYCWGYGHRCALGPDCRTPNTPTPVRIDIADRVVAVTSGYSSACAITTKQRALCWGDNSAGQLGSASVVDDRFCTDGGACSTTPVEVLGNHRWRQISMNSDVACGLTTGYHIYCWGAREKNNFALATQGSTEVCRNLSMTYRDMPCSTTPTLVVRHR